VSHTFKSWQYWMLPSRLTRLNFVLFVCLFVWSAGIDMFDKEVEVDGERVKVYIW